MTYTEKLQKICSTSIYQNASHHCDWNNSDQVRQLCRFAAEELAAAAKETDEFDDDLDAAAILAAIDTDNQWTKIWAKFKAEQVSALNSTSVDVSNVGLTTADSEEMPESATAFLLVFELVLIIFKALRK